MSALLELRLSCYFTLIHKLFHYGDFLSPSLCLQVSSGSVKGTFLLLGLLFSCFRSNISLSLCNQLLRSKLIAALSRKQLHHLVRWFKVRLDYSCIMPHPLQIIQTSSVRLSESDYSSQIIGIRLNLDQEIADDLTLSVSLCCLLFSW